MAEKAFFNQDGISVSNTRIVIGGQTFALNNITSVRTLVEQPSRKGPIILGIVGILSMMTGEGALIMLGLALIAGAVFWWMSTKTEYYVALTTAAGESKALSNKDEQYVDKIVQALNDAIIERG